MERDIDLKPREVGTRNPEELARILSGIYPQRTVEEIMTHFGFVNAEGRECNGAEKQARKPLQSRRKK